MNADTPQSWRLDIEGMSCAACVRHVERALRAVPGVASVSVNLASESAQISSQGDVALGDLAAALRGAGYALRLAPAQPAQTAAAVGAAPDRESWALIGGALCTLPLLLPMLVHPLGWHLMPPPWLQCLLATPVQFLLGARFYRQAWLALRHRSSNMDQLVALGSSAAYGMSVWLWLQGETQALYFEAAAAVIFMVRLGKWLEARARRETGAALRALRALQPEQARVLTADGERLVPLSALSLGDTLRVRPGERIPVDARILTGSSSVDESLLTGESMPQPRHPGERVIGGALNGEGNLELRVLSLAHDSTLGRIVRLVESAQAERAPIEALVDRVSAVFVPVVILIALATAGFGALAGLPWDHALIRAVSVLAIACPCALGLATPVVWVVGTGLAAQHGILIRRAAALEAASRIRHLVFDKTGTLTQGQPELATLRVLSGERSAALAKLAALHRGSEHPLAQASLRAAAAAGIAAGDSSAGLAVPGSGYRGRVEGRELAVGNAAWMRQLGLSDAVLQAQSADPELAPFSLAFLADLDASVPTLLAVAAYRDPPRAEARDLLQGWRDAGYQISVLSGDRPSATMALAASLGLDQHAVHAALPPAEKLARIRQWDEQAPVAMIGDGLNDAPALAAASLGIAMGSGTEAAQEAAAIVLLRGDLHLIGEALELARQIRRKTQQNLGWAFGFNLIGIPLAAAGALTPAFAGLAMALSSLCVIANALSLRRWRPPARRRLSPEAVPPSPASR